MLGMAVLTLIAGIDTTWSAIGARSGTCCPRRRPRAAGGGARLMATGVEELLRASAPVTMAREVTDDIEYHVVPDAKAGTRC